MQIDITGTEGALRITNVLAFQNKHDSEIEGMKGDATSFSPLPVPDEYKFLDDTGIDVSALELAYLYAAFASDKEKRHVRRQQLQGRSEAAPHP